ncbi:hypothetical protein ACF07T_37725 [Streptomyces sp. NPDC015184]|uniref:hypothetical protein n=1 Tax=Streptomyces sp. NPDC015184 TaxID=3364946 RepID=UPI0036FAEEF1
MAARDWEQCAADALSNPPREDRVAAAAELIGDDIVDLVVGFLEDPGADGGCPILADLEMSLVRGLHEMLRYRRGHRPFLIPSPGSHES